MTAPRLRAALLVSVVTTVRDEARNIAALLDSLVVQEPPLEIIVVDSASVDATRDIVRRYERAYENVHLYITGGRRGARPQIGVPEGTGGGGGLLAGAALPNPLWRYESRAGLRHTGLVARGALPI